MTKNQEFLINKELIYETQAEPSLISNEHKSIRIIHFNDVYNIESRSVEPCGGASRFVNALTHLLFSKENTLVVFSGDAFSPSVISSLLKGKQMCDVLNHCCIDVACIGNHEFDYGLETLDSLMKRCKFPWLLSNLKDSATKKPLCNAHTHVIKEMNGLKIGFIGLVEEEWMSTLGTIDRDELEYESFLLSGKKLARYLKGDEHKCDLVVAVTHMRLPNDELLTEKAHEIDLVLGGHDHDYYAKEINNRWLIKSGVDFREFSLIELSDGKRVSKIEKYIVDSLVQEDKFMREYIETITHDINKQLDIVLGEIHADLDGRFSNIRCEETNLGNFICDIILSKVDADCCLLNGGSFRSDTIHPRGKFTVRDLKKIIPFEDGLLVIEVTGKQLYEALENGVSEYPKREGRFPQVSGIRFEFDASKESMSRVNSNTIQINNNKLDLNGKYKLCTKEYLYCGKDGYECLMNAKILIESEEISPLFNMIQDHIHTINNYKLNRDEDRLRSSIVPLFIVNNLIREISVDASKILNSFNLDTEVANDGETMQKKRCTFKLAALVILKTLKLQKTALKTRSIRKAIKHTTEFKVKLEVYENVSLRLEPKIDGRIIRVNL